MKILTAIVIIAIGEIVFSKPEEKIAYGIGAIVGILTAILVLALR